MFYSYGSTLYFKEHDPTKATVYTTLYSQAQCSHCPVGTERSMRCGEGEVKQSKERQRRKFSCSQIWSPLVFLTCNHAKQIRRHLKYTRLFQLCRRQDDILNLSNFSTLLRQKWSRLCEYGWNRILSCLSKIQVSYVNQRDY